MFRIFRNHVWHCGIVKWLGPWFDLCAFLRESLFMFPKIIIKATIHKYALNCPGRWKIFIGFFHRKFHVLHSSLVIEAVLSLMPPAPIAWVFTQSPCNDWLPALAWGRGQQTPFSAFYSTWWCLGRSCFVGEKVWIFWTFTSGNLEGKNLVFLWYCK